MKVNKKKVKANLSIKNIEKEFKNFTAFSAIWVIYFAWSKIMGRPFSFYDVTFHDSCSVIGDSQFITCTEWELEIL